VNINGGQAGERTTTGIASSVNPNDNLEECKDDEDRWTGQKHTGSRWLALRLPGTNTLQSGQSLNVTSEEQPQKHLLKVQAVL
jgi:hypothetical protein